MKLYISLLLFVLISSQSFSKSKYGLLGGVSNATFFTKNVSTGSDYIIIKMPYSDYGMHVGGFYQLKLGLFVFQPEMYLSTISNIYKINKPQQSVESVLKNDRSFNLEMPLLFGLKAGILKLMAGPSGRLILYDLHQLQNYSGYDVEANRAMWGIQSLAGIEIQRFQLNLKYDVGISSFSKSIVKDGKSKTFNQRSGQIMLTACWELDL